MSTKLISEATPRDILELTDLLPLAVPGDPTAYHISGDNLFSSLPAATTASAGVVELATLAEIAGGSAGKAVEAGALADSYAGTHFVFVNSDPLTLGDICNAFLAAFDRSPASGDLITVKDDSDRYSLLTWDAESGHWRGFNLTNGVFVTY